LVTAKSLCGASPTFDDEICRSSDRHSVLCFDLRDDDHLKAGLVLSISNTDSKGMRLLIPFKTTAFAPQESLLATWGSYGNFTVLTYVPSSPGVYGIGIEPVFESSPDYLEDRRATSQSLVFLRLGLERRFIYRHRLPSDAVTYAQASRIETQPLDAVGIARPANAIGLELSNGRTEDPPAVFENGRARFYPVLDANGSPYKIEIRYQVPPTSTQALVLTYLSKLAGALAAPFIAILFFTLQDNVRPRIRKIVLWSLFTLQVLLLCGFGFVAIQTRSEAATSAIGDWIVVIVTALGAALPLWLRRPKPTQFAVRP